MYDSTRSQSQTSTSTSAGDHIWPEWTHLSFSAWRRKTLIFSSFMNSSTISPPCFPPLSNETNNIPFLCKAWITTHDQYLLHRDTRELTEKTIGPIRENDMTSWRVLDSIPKQMLDQEIYLFINPQCPWSNDETYLWTKFTHHIHWSDLTSDVGRHRVQPI